MNVKRLLSIFAVAVLVVAAIFILYQDREEIKEISPTPSPSAGTTTNVPTNITLQGEYVCLPKKGSGPHTLECAFGIKADDGHHYALSMNPGISNVYNVPTGSHIKVTGLLVPIEAVSTDMWRSYDIRGIISVETFEVK